MNPKLMSVRSLFFIALFLVSHFICISQDQAPVPAKGYYVVVGAFSVQSNAIRFQKTVNDSGIRASYGFLPSRDLYYVYVEGNTALPACLDEVKKVRANPQFADAWVRFMEDESTKISTALPQTEPNNQVVVQTPVVTTPPVEEVLVEEPTEHVSVPVLGDMTLGNMEVFLSLYNDNNDRVVDGKVQVVDVERGRLITEAKGNDYLVLPDPKSKSGKISLICDAFGYRKVQHELNYSRPLTDSTSLFVEEMGSALVVKFPLVRYQKGDIHALYNVYFYNDAAIFLPESKFELNELLVMMQENPKLRIRLHGHSNGSAHGKIIKMGKSGDFFSVAEDATTTVGSAKELSEARAEIIRDYLAANGVEATRMEVKAWGGKKPLYDKKGANAKKNIRVEVEIIGS